ncbi:MAG: hypothetical protein AB8A48_05710, partial [Prochlorococcus sp.]
MTQGRPIPKANTSSQQWLESPSGFNAPQPPAKTASAQKTDPQISESEPAKQAKPLTESKPSLLAGFSAEGVLEE